MRVAYEDQRMCIRTRCRDTEQLVGTFKQHVTGSSMFVPALGTRPVGTESPFEVSLCDGTVVMRGRGVIRQTWSNTNNPFHRPGILFDIQALTRSSKFVLDRIKGVSPPLDPTSIPIPNSPPPRDVAAPPSDPAAFVTDTGTWLGPPPARPGPGAEDAFFAILHAIPPRERLETPSRRSTQSVPVKVTIPPRGSRGDDAKPRIVSLHSVAVPRAVTQDRFSKTAIPALPEPATQEEDASPRAAPEEISAAITEPFVVPECLVPTERMPRIPTPPEGCEFHVDPPYPVVPADPHPVVTADPHPVVPANPLMALTDSALAGYVDCTLFETTTAAGQRGAVLSVRPRYRALWWLAAVVLAVAVLGAFQLRTEAAIVRNTDAAPHRSPASFDLTVVRRSVSEADRMTFDVVVTPLCADAK